MPLMRERDVELPLDALDRAPVERGLEGAALHPPPPGGHEALGDVALAPAVVRGVDGQAERGVAVGDGALDMVVDPGLVAAHIELKEPQRVGRRRRQVLEPGIADRAQHMRRRRTPRRRAPPRRRPADESSPASRPERAPPASAACARTRSTDASTLLTSRSTRGRNAIGSSAMRLRRSVVSVSAAADDVVPVVLVQVLPRLGDDLVQIEKVARVGRGVVDGLRGMCALA